MYHSGTAFSGCCSPCRFTLRSPGLEYCCALLCSYAAICRQAGLESPPGTVFMLSCSGACPSLHLAFPKSAAHSLASRAQCVPGTRLHGCACRGETLKQQLVCCRITCPKDGGLDCLNNTTNFSSLSYNPSTLAWQARSVTRELQCCPPRRPPPLCCGAPPAGCRTRGERLQQAAGVVGNYCIHPGIQHPSHHGCSVGCPGVHRLACGPVGSRAGARFERGTWLLCASIAGKWLLVMVSCLGQTPTSYPQPRHIQLARMWAITLRTPHTHA